MACVQSLTECLSKGKKGTSEEARKNPQSIRNQLEVNAIRTGTPCKSDHESGLASQRLFDLIFDDGLDDLRHTKPQHRQISEECQRCHWLSTIFTVNRKTYEDGNQIEKQIRRKEENIGNNTIGLFIHWNMTNNPFYTQIILTPIEQYSMSSVTEPMIWLHQLIEKAIQDLKQLLSD